LPQVLRTEFMRAFTEGLHDPARRLTDGEWMQALSKFRDALFECGHCKRETAYGRDVLKAGANLACVWCKREIATPTRMKIGPAVVMLSPQMRLYPHHLGETADFSAPVAELTAHPTKPNTWGLRNLSSTPWSYSVGDGPALTVEPGQAAPIKDGLKVAFGRAVGAVKA
ncbi:MAG: hypothetical protein K0S65_4489, partial [Labilithrix sp.]|nr:hypothetical protein [Labilithrix sp.]